MTSSEAHQAQRERAVESYLRIEGRLAERHSDGSRHSEHVTVDGREVEVVEDNLGIVELHLS